MNPNNLPSWILEMLKSVGTSNPPPATPVPQPTLGGRPLPGSAPYNPAENPLYPGANFSSESDPLRSQDEYTRAYLTGDKRNLDIFAKTHPNDPFYHVHELKTRKV